LFFRESLPSALIGPENNETDKLAQKTKLTLSFEQALAIATNSDCISSGLVQEEYFYNPSSKSWWFTMKADKPGCNPACVVLEETKTAEVNWRCTGLNAQPIYQVNESIKQLFADKYKIPKDSISIFIDREDASHVRGIVRFSPDSDGTIFLAVKIDGAWQLVFDDSGTVPCSLAKYGFLKEMLFDCAGT